MKELPECETPSSGAGRDTQREPKHSDPWHSDPDDVRVSVANRFASAYNMRSVAPLRDIPYAPDFRYTSHWYPLKEKTSRLFVRHFYRRFIEQFVTHRQVRCELVETRSGSREVQVAVRSGHLEVAASIATAGGRVSGIHMQPMESRHFRSGCLPGSYWAFEPPVPEQGEFILGIMEGIYLELLRQRIEEFCSHTLGLKCWFFYNDTDAGSCVEVHLPPPAAPHQPIRVPYPGEAAWERGEMDLFNELATSIERRMIEATLEVSS